MVSSRLVLEGAGPASLGRLARMGETGVVCSSERANLSKLSGEAFGVSSESLGRDVGGPFWTRRAWSAFRRYSDLGAMAYELERETADLVESGVEGRWELPKEEERVEDEEGMVSVRVCSGASGGLAADATISERSALQGNRTMVLCS